MTYLLVRKDEYKVGAFFRSFASLPDDVKLALSVAVIAASYFGAAFYVGGPPGAFAGDDGAGNTPASVDRSVDFAVPASLPADEKDFFNFMLGKLTDEILADLPTVYEMDGEAVAWIKRMVEYNVAGGKMNRGLAVVSVQVRLCPAWKCLDALVLAHVQAHQSPLYGRAGAPLPRLEMPLTTLVSAHIQAHQSHLSRHAGAPLVRLRKTGTPHRPPSHPGTSAPRQLDPPSKPSRGPRVGP